MEKSVTMNLRVNPSVKKQAEDVLKQLGIPMATAIDMYLRQISLTGGIPFSVANEPVSARFASKGPCVHQRRRHDQRSTAR